MKFGRHNPKKEQMIEDRYTEIERANRILLEKMSNILKGRARSIGKQRIWKGLPSDINNSICKKI
jgi:hypothetical protein